MGIKNFIVAFLLVSSLMISFSKVHAAPPAEELNQYLAEIGWSKQELVEYLNYFEIPLEEFNSVEELKSVLGTPINEKNLQELLKTYNLSKEELNDLLKQFGDSLDEYKFIEDLDTALTFYTNHDDFLDEINKELAKLGITEAEIQNLFNHLAMVEENNPNQLDLMESLDYRIEQLLETADPTELTTEQINELADVVEDIFQAYSIQVKIKYNDKAISLNELLRLKKPGKLYMSFSTLSNEPLLDFTIPADYFEEMMSGWEQIIHIGDIANEFVDFLHDEKYQNDTRYK
ncbi:processed acidic surface protein [Bacillus rubiinfantis]|uniref:processed acidic surface protein n=1 Tax=Bacillus rubiinfantis TaxID=1499680 RepID=UPI0006936646|nr:processed acidic surface protein [Bacillus rubiinfantis]